MRNAHWISLALIATAAGVCPAQTLSDANLTYTTLTTPGLSLPTGLRFIGADDFFAIEKASGKVKRYLNGSAGEVLDLPVNSSSERGLLGLAVHPDFPAAPWVYTYYSLASGGDGGAWLENRVSRFTWDGSSLAGETVLLSFEADPSQANGPNHDGGPLTFGPDGMLYGVTGDLNRNRAEQNNQSLPGTSSDAGGIFRIRDDGTAPDGSVEGETPNPFVGEANADFHKWFAYGIRNSFGLAFDPGSGNLWQTENGPSSYDEVNLVAPGFNSGWRAIMGPDSRDSQGVGDLVMLPGASYSDPELSWLSPIAVTSIVFLHGSALGAEYDDAAIIGDNNRQQLYLVRLNGARDGFALTGGLADLVADSSAERDSLRLGEDFGVITDLQIGPDGALYVLSLSQGKVYRIALVPVAGDTNGDRVVDAADYIALKRNLGQGTGAGVAGGDFDEDGTVEWDDLQTLVAGINAGAAAVPEPATLGLLGLGGLMVLRRRRS